MGSQGEIQSAIASFEEGKDILECLEGVLDLYPLSLLAMIMRGIGDTIAADRGDMEETLMYYRQCREMQLNSIGIEAIEYTLTERKIRSLLHECLRGSKSPPQKASKSKVDSTSST